MSHARSFTGEPVHSAVEILTMQRKKRVSFTVALLALVLQAPAALAVKAGDPAPSWRSTDVNGRSITFPDPDAGRTTVLVFWATWCPYCQAFMPYLARIQQDYADRNVQILAVNAKESDDADPAAYMREHGYGFTTVLDGDAVAAAYAVRFIPGLMVVGPDGRVIYRRGWTELPAGQTVAQLWDRQVREVLDSQAL